MARTKAYALSSGSKGSAYMSGMGYKGVMRRGSKYGWKYEDGKTCQQKGGFDTAEEAAYNYDEFLTHYVGPNADTNQSLGLLKLKHVLAVREKIQKAEKPHRKTSRATRRGACGFKGVSKNPSPKSPFKSQLYLHGKYIHIGTFKTAEEAARAYDRFVLQHVGNNAETNISLGLLSPIGETDIKPASPRMAAAIAEPLPEVELTEEPGEMDYQPCRTPEEEREAQRLAALAMAEAEEEEPEEVTPPPAPAPEPAAPRQELIVHSKADELRQRAEAMLREAAAIEATNAREAAARQIDELSVKVSAMQNIALSLIDCVADIELQIQKLKDSFK